MCGKLKEKAIAAVYLCLWVQALRHMQLDYEKRVRDVEKQRGQLLAEMDTREVELLKRIDILEEDKRVLERRLKKSVSERDHFYELNTILASENDRLAVLSPFLPPPLSYSCYSLLPTDSRERWTIRRRSYSLGDEGSSMLRVSSTTTRRSRNGCMATWRS